MGGGCGRDKKRSRVESGGLAMMETMCWRGALPDNAISPLHGPRFKCRLGFRFVICEPHFRVLKPLRSESHVEILPPVLARLALCFQPTINMRSLEMRPSRLRGRRSAMVIVGRVARLRRALCRLKRENAEKTTGQNWPKGVLRKTQKPYFRII